MYFFFFYKYFIITTNYFTVILFFSHLNTPYLWQRPVKDGGTCLLSHHCNSTGQIFEYGSSNGSDWFFSPITLNTSLLSLLRFLSLLHPCPAWSGPPYICNEKRPFFYFLSHSLCVTLSFSLLCHHSLCVHSQKSSLGLNRKWYATKEGLWFFKHYNTTLSFSAFMAISKNVLPFQVYSNWVVLLGHGVAWNLLSGRKKQSFACLLLLVVGSVQGCCFWGFLTSVVVVGCFEICLDVVWFLDFGFVWFLNLMFVVGMECIG